MKVERIVFLQGQAAEEALNIYKNTGSEGALQYLDQWTDLGNHETSDSLSHGSSDSVYYISDYVLSVNTNLNYIGLEYITERGEKK